MLVVLSKEDFQGRDWKGCSLDLFGWSTDALGSWAGWFAEGQRVLSSPETHAWNFHPLCAADEPGTQTMLNSPAKANVSPYEELASGRN